MGDEDVSTVVCTCDLLKCWAGFRFRSITSNYAEEPARMMGTATYAKLRVQPNEIPVPSVNPNVGMIDRVSNTTGSVMPFGPSAYDFANAISQNDGLERKHQRLVTMTDSHSSNQCRSCIKAIVINATQTGRTLCICTPLTSFTVRLSACTCLSSICLSPIDASVSGVPDTLSRVTCARTCALGRIRLIFFTSMNVCLIEFYPLPAFRSLNSCPRRLVYHIMVLSLIWLTYITSFEDPTKKGMPSARYASNQCHWLTRKIDCASARRCTTQFRTSLCAQLLLSVHPDCSASLDSLRFYVLLFEFHNRNAELACPRFVRSLKTVWTEHRDSVRPRHRKGAIAERFDLIFLNWFIWTYDGTRLGPENRTGFRLAPELYQNWLYGSVNKQPTVKLAKIYINLNRHHKGSVKTHNKQTRFVIKSNYGEEGVVVYTEELSVKRVCFDKTTLPLATDGCSSYRLNSKLKD
ncbi:hypothetical protein CLF_101985 [Clonorchis sinensis]|uniref:Uncharacterized protein n=1 Tax=Clonorchis sinensis TaxID=79923 RepID=G7Y713_CLOSI|nr:hypothetical protein CLF_101985 [Clonorchis sinensis]